MTKLKKDLSTDFYTIRKTIYPSFLRTRMVGVGRPLLPEILGQPARIGVICFARYGVIYYSVLSIFKNVYCLY